MFFVVVIVVVHLWTQQGDKISSCPSCSRSAEVEQDEAVPSCLTVSLLNVSLNFVLLAGDCAI